MTKLFVGALPCHFDRKPPSLSFRPSEASGEICWWLGDVGKKNKTQLRRLTQLICIFVRDNPMYYVVPDWHTKL